MNGTDVGPCAAAHGFELLSSVPLEEIGGSAHVLRHTASKARLLYLQNDDNNKGFSITFKTPASDDTGVFHILEHSVLCGSRKFPVKEPFVNLLKSSMQTFLNAMTFPDKTMYPVASTNERDLLNLADVYMDAVFHPNIYKNPRIFEQEGWHYEFDEEDDGALVYNGVVFNEMKGALSDPESVLYDTLSAALFPDTTYRFESGGTPKCIPTLTYEGFLEQHRRHYTPENSYIVLYGNLDLDAFLGFLDGQYLSSLSAEGRTGADTNTLELQAPVVAEGVRRKMPTAPENSCAALGFVAGRADERERLIATSVLVDALLGSNEAPMKRALLDADIADDCDGFLADSVLQPFVAVTARGLHGPDAPEKLARTVRVEAERLASGALDEEVVEAALSHAEFVMREGNFGYADGVVLSMAAMNGWLYDDTPDAACAYIRYEDAFASLRRKLGTGYFAGLVRELFLESTHHAQVEVVPTGEDEEGEELAKLAALRETMSAAELEGIAENVAVLRAAQRALDDPADVAKLPRLTRADIGKAPEEPACRLERKGMLRVLKHDVETHGIVYATKYFDASTVAFDELPYLTVLAMALGKTDTAAHTASQVDTLVQKLLGSLDFACEVFESEDDPKAFDARFTASFSALSANIGDATALFCEVLQESDFNDSQRLYDLLLQRKVSMEQRFAMAGNGVASARAASYFLPAAQVREKLGGVDFYVFLKSLIANYETASEPLARKLDELRGRILTDDGCLLSFAGSDDDLKACLDGGMLLGIKADPAPSVLATPEPKDRREALVVPTDITYTALVADRRWLEGDAARFDGSWMVASRILSYDYLWNEVRVMGGAYGVGFNAARTGASAFSSYRDPHVAETLHRFREAGGWLSAFESDDEEFEGYVVSTAASFDKPLKPCNLVRRQAVMHLSGYTREQFLRYRSQVVDATVEGTRAIGEAVGRLADAGYVCVVGNKDIIEQSGVDVSKVDLLAL